MSRNYELFVTLNREREMLGWAMGPTGRAERRTRDPHLEIDPASQNKIEEVVRRVFLMPGRNVLAQCVVFCGLDFAGPSTRLCWHSADLLAASVSSDMCVIDLTTQSADTNGQCGFLDMMQYEPVPDCVTQPWQDNLYVMPRGKAEQNGGINSVRIAECFNELLNRFRYVLVNAPTLAVSDEAFLLGRFSNGVILTVDPKATKRRDLRHIRSKASSAQVRLIGAVLSDSVTGASA